jgi:hypothetical protein
MELRPRRGHCTSPWNTEHEYTAGGNVFLFAGLGKRPVIKLLQNILRFSLKYGKISRDFYCAPCISIIRHPEDGHRSERNM